MMAGTKRRKKTGKSAAKTPSPLPSQYTFVARSTAPPPLPNRQSGLSVSDYPPPTQLFQTSTAQPPAASYPARQASPLPRPRGSQTSATEKPPPRQPPVSSQAQNANSTQAPEDEFPEESTPVQPTLSEDQMRFLYALLSQPGRELYTKVLSPTFEPGTTWFGRKGNGLSKKIRKICTNKFDDAFYSWSVVPPDRKEMFFVEFAKTHHWHPSQTGVVQEKFEKICQRRLKDMVSKCRRSRVRPSWINTTLWTKMTEFWDTAAARDKSKKTSSARMSDRGGLGPHKHNTGQKSFQQIEQEMVEELGRPVTLGEVFIKTHTKKMGALLTRKLS
ncbi:hypothetical protein Bca101_057542 [Brassica carinata]